VLAVLCVSPVARADEITLVAPGGIQAAVQQLIPGFERATGHTVKATFGSGLGTKRQVAAGEPFDVPIVQPPYSEVVSSGHVVADSATPLAAVAVGLLSHVPGGLGVFEAMLLLMLPNVPTEELLGSLLAFRAVYYLAPLVVGALAFLVEELRAQSPRWARAQATTRPAPDTGKPAGAIPGRTR